MIDRKTEDTLKRTLESLPEKPGIYKMFNEQGRLIYIGKSKCLKNRVRSYFVPEPVWEKARRMAPLIKEVQYEVTDTHLEAMLLECAMIKKHKPFFNAQMKEDNRYVYLQAETDARKNPLSIVHEREQDSFGPFRSKSQLENLAELLKNWYPIKRLRKHYELEYHLFPEKLDSETFQKNREQILELLKNPESMEYFLKDLEKQMKQAAGKEQYALAGRCRDLLQQMQYIARGLKSYQAWTQGEILYHVDVDGGFKFFYLNQGMVIQKMWTETLLSEKEKIDFTTEARKKVPGILETMSPKELLDYRDIVYGELRQASEETIEVILK